MIQQASTTGGALGRRFYERSGAESAGTDNVGGGQDDHTGQRGYPCPSVIADPRLAPRPSKAGGADDGGEESDSKDM